MSKHLEALLRHHRDYASLTVRFGFTLLGQAETDRLGMWCSSAFRYKFVTQLKSPILTKPAALCLSSTFAWYIITHFSEHVNQNLLSLRTLEGLYALTNAVRGMLEKRKEKYVVRPAVTNIEGHECITTQDKGGRCDESSARRRIRLFGKK